MGIYKETIRKYMIGHQMRQVVANSGVLDLDQFYLDATAVGATQDKTLFESELEALPDLVKNEAETILVPGIYKNGKVYGFNGSTKGLVEFDFSRSSSATYFDKNGVMRVASAGMPRIDYDPATGLCRGYLVEPGSQNLLPNSATDFDGIGATSAQFDWGKGDLLTTGGIIRRGDATSYAYRGANLVKGRKYTFSCFVKKQDNTVPISNDMAVTLAGGVNRSFDAFDMGGGVYRIESTFEATEDRFGTFGITKQSSGSDIDITFTGYQLEEGVDSATSYMPTSESTTVRSLDIISLQTSPFDPASGSLYTNFELFRSGDIQTVFKRFTNGFIYFLGGSFRIYDGVNNLNMGESPFGRNILSVSYSKEGDIKGIIVGRSLRTMPYAGYLSFSSFVIDGSANGLISNRTRSVAIFSRQLSDQEHIDITT